MIGASAGLILRNVGVFGRLIGKSLAAALIAACTSRAARSTLRFRSNCNVIEHSTSVLTEVISVTPEICPNRRSKGAATEDATVAGSAPGNEAEIEMTGKSTRGNAATGRKRYATIPIMNKPAASNDVPTGRLMKGAEMFIYERALNR